MPTRMRVTVKPEDDRVTELRTAAKIRQDLWAHSPVEVDPDHPLHGTHRDEEGHAYFEFSTEFPEEVRRVIDQYNYANRIELSEAQVIPGDECASCGNVAGPVLPAICPSCGFQDISPCPVCEASVPRQSYARISGDLFRCPHCCNQVRLRFNNPMFLADGSYNQPLVLVEKVTAHHEVR